MRYLGYDDKIFRILESLYTDTMSAVRVYGGLSTAVGVLQGRVLSLLLFNILLQVVMMLALKRMTSGSV